MLLKIGLVVSFLISINAEMELKKVVVLSRHNLRTPLDKELISYTRKPWPKWNAEPGLLTPKGVLLEKYMGTYFQAWIQEKRLFANLEKESCPEEKYVNIFANSMPRTIETAKAFTEAAFPNCNFSVNYNKTSYPKMNQLFRYLVNNDTEDLKLAGLKEIREKLDGANLQDVYEILNKVADVKNSDACKNYGICDLKEDADQIVFLKGHPPSVRGRFGIAKSMVDAFLMSYYEGRPLKDVGWGEIQTEAQWKTLSKILKVEMDLRFNLTVLKESRKALVGLLVKELRTDYKFSFIAAHDATFIIIMVPLEFEPFELQEQYEPTPVGAKLVFQKWTNGTEDFLKIEYVYQSCNQIRNTEKLSFEHPPKNLTISLKKCSTDHKGFCLWSDFEKILNNLI